jgi:hypothetical protein
MKVILTLQKDFTSIRTKLEKDKNTFKKTEETLLNTTRLTHVN